MAEGDITKVYENDKIEVVMTWSVQVRKATKIMEEQADGSKKELINTFKKIKNKKINENTMKNNLYTKNVPDPDILIRTGGKKRLSNFLLWQLAYTELYFLDKLWPDFSSKDLKKILKDFYKIKRNFGGI